MRRGSARWTRALLVLAGCQVDPVFLEGELGRPIALVSDDSPLPRLLFIDDDGGACPRIAGTCSGLSCEPILIDSLLPITTIRTEDVDAPSFTRACVEVRAGLMDESVTRFRFRELPVVRAPSEGDGLWTWQAGDEDDPPTMGAVLGGNALREFAVAIRTPPGAGTTVSPRPDDAETGGSTTGDADPPASAPGTPTVSFFGEFPGSDRDLANQGRAFFPLQFPGRLLGKDLNDRCDISGEDCYVGGVSIQGGGRPNIALASTRMVLDACVAVPPCGVRYAPAADASNTPGECSETPGPSVDPNTKCGDPLRVGREASLVVATGVPGLVLFSDSAVRMFGPLDELPACDDAVDDGHLACREPERDALSMPGWPAAEDLVRLRVRSVALVPGLTRSRGPSACTRVAERRQGLLDQCRTYVRAAERTAGVKNVLDTRPPYTDHVGENQAASTLAVLGEASFAEGSDTPDPSRWLETLVLPPEHALPLALRRDVTPEAIQPDGLLGAAMFDDTVVVLDYTDPNPGVRLSCLDPNAGRCVAAPACGHDGDAACCFGQPIELLEEFIRDVGNEICCVALSAESLAAFQTNAPAHCLTTLPP